MVQQNISRQRSKFCFSLNGWPDSHSSFLRDKIATSKYVHCLLFCSFPNCTSMCGTTPSKRHCPKAANTSLLMSTLTKAYRCVFTWNKGLAREVVQRGASRACRAQSLISPHEPQSQSDDRQTDRCMDIVRVMAIFVLFSRGMVLCILSWSQTQCME